MRSVEASLDEIFALRLSNQRLQFGSGECVNETGLRHDK